MPTVARAVAVVVVAADVVVAYLASPHCCF